MSRLYLVTIEVEGLVLAESEEEALGLADWILDTEDERRVAAEEIEAVRSSVPIEWTDDCILYTPDETEYIDVRTAIEIVAREASGEDDR